jgi:ribosomal protein L7/L12
MSIKLILLLIFVGLVSYLLGRLAGARRGDGGQMLQTSAARTLDAARAAQAGTLDFDSLEEIKRLIRERQLISAIKIYRQRTNCGLRQAKEAVEAIAKTL